MSSPEILPQFQNAGIEGFQRSGGARKLGGNALGVGDALKDTRSAEPDAGKLWSVIYRLRRSMLAVGADRDLKWKAEMVAEDRWMELVGTCGWMVQVSGGTSPDWQEPMASEAEVGQGDWSA